MTSLQAPAGGAPLTFAPRIREGVAASPAYLGLPLSHPWPAQSIATWPLGVGRARQVRLWAQGGRAPLRLLPISMFGGHAWGQLPLARGGRTTLGASVPLARGLYAGLSVHGLRARVGAPASRSWDVGLLLRPRPWLSLSAGFDSLRLGPPGLGQRPRAARVGFAWRPWSGPRGMTLGADARLRASLQEGLVLQDHRLVLDVVPLAALHLTVGFAQRRARRQMWLGVGLDLTSLGQGSAAAPAAAGPTLAAR